MGSEAGEAVAPAVRARARAYPSESRLLTTLRQAHAGRLARGVDADPSDPSLDAVIERGRAASHARLWLTGGEPTVRADLPALCTALSANARVELGVISDGSVLAQAGALERLCDAGLRRVRLCLHSANPGAHDFLVGQRGATRRLVSAAQRAVQLGLGLELAATLTRPTSTQLAAWVRLGVELGAQALRVHRLRLDHVAAADRIMLGARLSLVQDELELAASHALRAEVPFTLEGFPVCVAPRLQSLFSAGDAVEWLAPAGGDWAAWTAAPRCASACPDCAQRPACSGAPDDYTGQFGHAEFRSERGLSSARVGGSPATPNDPAPTDAQPATAADRVAPPPVRGYRDPATRSSHVRAQVARSTLDGDPITGDAERPVPDVIWASLGGSQAVACAACAATPIEPAPSSRELRRALVVAAQRGAKQLRVVDPGLFAHPAAKSLLPELLRLSFERVELIGEASPLAEWRDDELARLKRLTRLDVIAYGADAAHHDAHVGRPGAWDGMQRARERLQGLAALQLGCHAVLHDGAELDRYAAAWSAGQLPGEPTFRLSTAGGSLRELAATAERLPDGACRRAVRACLPRCLGGTATLETLPDPGDCFWPGHERPPRLTGSDRYGNFDPCTCRGSDDTNSRCARPVGWSLD